MQSYSDWVVAFTKQIGRGIEKSRNGRSDQWISERTEMLGHQISRTAISEYRRGVRKVMPVTDWLVISAALGVPPVTLLFPDLPDGVTELFPASGEANSFDALMWVTGERETIPSSVDLLFDVESANPTGYIEGLKGYERYDEGPTTAHVNTYLNSLPSDQFQVLKLLRNLVEVHESLNKENRRISSSIRETLPKPVLDGLLKAYSERMDELSAEKTAIEDKIQALGGVLKEERAFDAEGNEVVIGPSRDNGDD